MTAAVIEARKMMNSISLILKADPSCLRTQQLQYAQESEGLKLHDRQTAAVGEGIEGIRRLMKRHGIHVYTRDEDSRLTSRQVALELPLRLVDISAFLKGKGGRERVARMAVKEEAVRRLVRRIQGSRYVAGRNKILYLKNLPASARKE